MKKIASIELEMLAGAAIGWTEEETEDFIDDDGDWDHVLYEKLGIELEEFATIANALIHLTPALESALTKSKHHVFGRETEGGFLAIAKVEATYECP